MTGYTNALNSNLTAIMQMQSLQKKDFIEISDILYSH